MLSFGLLGAVLGFAAMIAAAYALGRRRWLDAVGYIPTVQVDPQEQLQHSYRVPAPLPVAHELEPRLHPDDLVWLWRRVGFCIAAGLLGIAITAVFFPSWQGFAIVAASAGLSSFLVIPKQEGRWGLLFAPLPVVMGLGVGPVGGLIGLVVVAFGWAASLMPAFTGSIGEGGVEAGLGGGCASCGGGCGGGCGGCGG